VRELTADHAFFSRLEYLVPLNPWQIKLANAFFPGDGSYLSGEILDAVNTI
jgi:hypothetical protein